MAVVPVALDGVQRLHSAQVADVHRAQFVRAVAVGGDGGIVGLDDVAGWIHQQNDVARLFEQRFDVTAQGRTFLALALQRIEHLIELLRHLRDLGWTGNGGTRCPIASGDLSRGSGQLPDWPNDGETELPRQRQHQQQHDQSDGNAAVKRPAVVGEYRVLWQAGKHTPAGTRQGKHCINARHAVHIARGDETFAHATHRGRLHRGHGLADPGGGIGGAQQKPVRPVEHRHNRVLGYAAHHPRIERCQVHRKVDKAGAPAVLAAHGIGKYRDPATAQGSEERVAGSEGFAAQALLDPGKFQRTLGGVGSGRWE